MNRLLEVKKYVISYITAVSVFWLLYWIISWGLYGLANLSESRTLMTWLGAAYCNDFGPAKHSPLYGEIKYDTPTIVVDSLDNSHDSEAEDIANGVKYLNENDVWVRDEMDSIQCLQGLFDELNHYDLDKLLERDSCIKESIYIREIIYSLERLYKSPHSEKIINKTYTHDNDNKIIPMIYQRRIIRILDMIDRETKNNNTRQRQMKIT